MRTARPSPFYPVLIKKVYCYWGNKGNFEGRGGGSSKILTVIWVNILYFVQLTICNCAIACKPFGTPFHELQIYLTQHGCASTHRTGIYCGLEASPGHSLEWRLVTLVHRNIQVATNLIGCIWFVREFGN